MDAFQILVIILSIVLALFLIGAIILVILLIRVTSQIKRVTESAERTAGGVEKVMMTLGKASAPMMISRLIIDQFKKVRKK